MFAGCARDAVIVGRRGPHKWVIERRDLSESEFQRAIGTPRRDHKVIETVRLRPWPTHLAAGSAVFNVALGLTVLVGWFSRTPALVQLLPQLPPMTRNAAVCFVLCGLALLMVALRSPRWLVVVCAGIVSVVSILTLVEYVFHVNSGIDELLGPSYIAVNLSNPGRMAPISALCFALGALVLLTPKILSRRSALWLGLSGSIIAAVGMATSMGFALGSSDVFGWGNVTRSALHTAVGLWVLGFGMLALAWQVDTDRTAPRAGCRSAWRLESPPARWACGKRSSPSDNAPSLSSLRSRWVAGA